MTAEIIQFPIKKRSPHLEDEGSLNEVSAFDRIYTCTICGTQGKMLSIFADAQFCGDECFNMFL